MDYVMITAILTFFVLFFFLKNKEGYTDSYINGAIESLKKTSGNIEKTVLNIKDLTNTNNSGSSPLKIDVLEAIKSNWSTQTQSLLQKARLQKTSTPDKTFPFILTNNHLITKY
jgi:hypothetical protein